MKPKDRQNMIQSLIDTELAKRKSEDHGWEDLVDVRAFAECSLCCAHKSVCRTRTSLLQSHTLRGSSSLFHLLARRLRLVSIQTTIFPTTAHAVCVSVAADGGSLIVAISRGEAMQRVLGRRPPTTRTRMGGSWLNAGDLMMTISPHTVQKGQRIRIDSSLTTSQKSAFLSPDRSDEVLTQSTGASYVVPICCPTSMFSI